MAEMSMGRDPDWVFVPDEDRPINLDDLWDEDDERRER